MSRLVVTGHTSTIALALIALVQERTPEMEIIRVGRDVSSSLRVDFAIDAEAREFADWLAGEAPEFVLLNHGVLPGRRLREMPCEVAEDAVRVNLTSYVMAIEALSAVQSCRTVVMTSISGKAGSYDSLYAACKAGVDLIVRATATRLPPSSRMNAIAPGIISDARMTLSRRDTDVLGAKRARTPTREFAKSTEIARLAYFLFFESGQIQGESIDVNGGLYIR